MKEILKLLKEKPREQPLTIKETPKTPTIHETLNKILEHLENHESKHPVTLGQLKSEAVQLQEALLVFDEKIKEAESTELFIEVIDAVKRLEAKIEGIQLLKTKNMELEREVLEKLRDMLARSVSLS